MAIAIDEVVEAAARGVLRAMSARADGLGGARAVEFNAAQLVRSGFFVDLVIRAGGRPFQDLVADINPQPLPPAAQAGQLGA